MFDRVSLKIRNFPKALGFYRAVLVPLGYEAQHLHEQWKSVGFGPKGNVALWIAEEPSRVMVSQFFEAALNAGEKDDGKPGLRPDYAKDYCAAFPVDSDGKHIEAVTFSGR